jgi:hypothetical protein
MQLFAGSTQQFLDETQQKTIAERLGKAFYDYYRFRATASEFSCPPTQAIFIGPSVDVARHGRQG